MSRQEPYSDLRLYSRLLRDTRPYWRHLALAFILSLVAMPMTLLTPVPLKIVVDNVINARPLEGLLAFVLPQALEQSPGMMLVTAIGLLVLVTLIQQIEGFGSWILQLYTGERMVLDFRIRLFRHAQRLSLQYHDQAGASDTLYRIEHDAPAMQYLIVQGLIPAITSVLTVVAILCVTAYIDLWLAFVAITIVPVLLGLTELYRRRVRLGWATVKEQESSAMSVVQEVLGAVRVVKAFGQEKREEYRFSTHANRSLWTQIGVVLTEARFGILVAVTVACGTGAVLYIGARHVQAGLLSLGDLLVVMAYLSMLYKPLETLSRKAASLQASLASAERAYRLFDEQDEVPETTAPQPLKRARGHIEFVDVSYAYPHRQPVLHNLTFQVTPGTSVGIAGPTGAGKTTLIGLLFRFFDPTEGHIKLDGTDIRDFRLTDLRNQFAIVLQEPVLFAATIAENIAYGRPDASPEEIIAAAVAANAHEFIEQLPEGYQTVVGQRGAGISGGQRQRISLARAFLKDAPILVLDEPTSSVDVLSESLIMEAMRRLMQGRTTLMISHRSTTLEASDLRLQLEHGRIVSLARRDQNAISTSNEPLSPTRETQ